MIYLDHNATTPVLTEVLEAMLPWLTTNWGNPSSIHAPGRAARRAIEEARTKVAALIGSRPDQIIFTSGATESNNTAIHSALLRDPSRRHIVTSTVEHSAVLAYCNYLERHHGVEVTRLPVDSEGMLSEAVLRLAIRPDTALVSLMWANNETGVIWPVEKFAKICSDAGVLLHSDAVQAVGRIPVHFGDCGVSFLSISGHKFGGPKGVGALIVSDPSAFEPMILGGKQEHERRGGTENVPNIVALGTAADVVMSRGIVVCSGIEKIRNTFEREVCRRIEGTEVNGGASNRLPNTSNLHFPGIDGDSLVTYLDQHGICISSGSACLESSITPSHVILAMTRSHERANESIRISIGINTSEEELLILTNAIAKFIAINV